VCAVVVRVESVQHAEPSRTVSVLRLAMRLRCVVGLGGPRGLLESSCNKMKARAFVNAAVGGLHHDCSRYAALYRQ